MLSKLDYGAKQQLLVRREAVPLGLDLKILYASDLHLRPKNEAQILNELREAFHRHTPDVVLLGGDLSDHPSCLPALSFMIRGFSAHALVGAISGNHDFLSGRDRVRSAVLEGGGHWLPERAIECRGVQLLGSLEHYDRVGPAILCAHYPTVFPEAYKAGVELVFAGHLHGWQIVFGQYGEYLYPGAWLSRWNGLRFERENSTMLVSRGMTDLFPLRWNCPREVILAKL